MNSLLEIQGVSDAKMRVAETCAQDSIEADKAHATSPPLCIPEPPLNTTKSFGTDHDIKSQMKPSEEITHGSTECTSNEVLYVEGKHAWMRNSSATQDRSRPEGSVIDHAHHGRLVQAPAVQLPRSRHWSTSCSPSSGGEDHLWQDSCRQDLGRCVADLSGLDQTVPAALRREWQDGAPSHDQAHQVEDRRGRESCRDTDVSEVNMEILSAMESEAPWVIAEEQQQTGSTSAWSIWKMLCTRFRSI